MKIPNAHHEVDTKKNFPSALVNMSLIVEKCAHEMQLCYQLLFNHEQSGNQPQHVLYAEENWI